ncbi:NAD-dependent DNA ligase LigA, partial [Candidatus Uhrbacteria bacterium]|nr:NAD-dependent DNA ligase LigA [Candidatus Uhrbacteria bacterium]
VWVAGTTVQHASLHNMDEIRRLDMRIGDTVIIHKAGDIIPKVIRVLSDLRSGREKKIEEPKRCPVCGSPLARKEGEVALLCTSRDCYARLRERIIYAVSKQGFSIDGLGEKTIDQLLERGLIHNAMSLFALTKDDFLSLEGFADVSAQKSFDEIQRRKTVVLHRFITALGIEHVGSETALRLADHFLTLDDFLRAGRETLLAVQDVGPVVADSILKYLASSRHRHEIAEFQQHGGKVLDHPKRGGALHGRTFVLTGVLQHMSRLEAKAAIEALGGSVSSSVSVKTDFVVVGETPGSKEARAKALGVRCLNEREFFDMIGAEL